MNKLKFLLFIILPVTAIAQLDKIKPGMTREEVKIFFPGLKPDISLMSSWVITRDTLQGIQGHTEYVIRQDTELRYEFTSDEIAGPCKDYPHTDSIKYLQMMKVAKGLYSQYLSRYGKPEIYSGQPGFALDSGKTEVPLFYAKWKQGSNELSIEVSYPGKSKKAEMNAPLPTAEQMKPGCDYTLEILSLGTGTTFQRSCGNGITGQEFKNRHPALSSQVENHPDAWMTEDTSRNNPGAWRFNFESDQLDSYSYDILDGAGYSQKAEDAYNLIRKRVLTLFAEAKKAYGIPVSYADKMSEKYPGKGDRMYHRTTHFTAEWTFKGKNLYIIFDESNGGKQYEPIFHLTVYYGRPMMEE
jgi:hypothetical protein